MEGVVAVVEAWIGAETPATTVEIGDIGLVPAQ